MGRISAINLFQENVFLIGLLFIGQIGIYCIVL